MNFGSALVVLASLVPAQQQSAEFYHDFRGGQPLPRHMKLIGPDADAAVEIGPEGLRITLPRGIEGQRPGTGVDAGLVVQGDFEITLGYEMITEPDPADAGKQTRLSLAVTLDNTGQNMASLSRMVVPRDGRRFVSWVTLIEQPGGKTVPRAESVPTQVTSGRLRLVRSGAELQYYVASEGDQEFTLLRTYPFRATNVKEVRIATSTGGPEASLDVRVTDLRIRAEHLENLPAVASAPPAKPAGRGLVAAGLVLGMVVPLSVIIGVRFYMRRGKNAQRAEA